MMHRTQISSRKVNTAQNMHTVPLWCRKPRESAQPQGNLEVYEKQNKISEGRGKLAKKICFNCIRTERWSRQTTHFKHIQDGKKNWHLHKYHSVQFSHSVVSNSLRPDGLQQARPPGPSPTSRVYSNLCPSSQWCYPTISPSVIPFSSCLQSFPASGSFPMSQFFESGGQNIGVSVSTSVLPVNSQD